MSIVKHNMSDTMTLMNFMTTSQAAEHFGVSTKTIQRWIAAGKLTAERIDGRWFVHHESESIQHEGHSVQNKGHVPDAEQDRPNDGHLRELLSRADSEIVHLREQLSRRDQQIDSFTQQADNLTQQIDHMTQLLAVQTKNNAMLTEQFQLLEDLRRRPWWQRVLGR